MDVETNNSLIYCSGCRCPITSFSKYLDGLLCDKCFDIIKHPCVKCGLSTIKVFEYRNLHTIDDNEFPLWSSINQMTRVIHCIDCSRLFMENKACVCCDRKLLMCADMETYIKKQICTFCDNRLAIPCQRCFCSPTISDYDNCKKHLICNNCMEIKKQHGCMMAKTETTSHQNIPGSHVSRFISTGLCLDCYTIFLQGKCEMTRYGQILTGCQICDCNYGTWKSTLMVSTYQSSILLPESKKMTSYVSLLPIDIINHLINFQYPIKDILIKNPLWPEQYILSFIDFSICPMCMAKLPENCYSCHNKFKRYDMKSAVPFGVCRKCTDSRSHLCPKCKYIIDKNSLNIYYEYGVCSQCYHTIQDINCPKCSKSLTTKDDYKSYAHQSMCQYCYQDQFTNSCLSELPCDMD